MGMRILSRNGNISDVGQGAFGRDIRLKLLTSRQPPPGCGGSVIAEFVEANGSAKLEASHHFSFR
jgi:hypothetical protein